MSLPPEPPHCACTCHYVEGTCALDSDPKERHPRTGCCACCPVIQVPREVHAPHVLVPGVGGCTNNWMMCHPATTRTTEM